MFGRFHPATFRGRSRFFTSPFRFFQEESSMAKRISVTLRVGETQRAAWWSFTLTCVHDNDSPEEYFALTLRYRHGVAPHRFVVDMANETEWRLYHDTFGYDAGAVLLVEGGLVVTDPHLAIGIARYLSDHPSHREARLPEAAIPAAA
jgi:hypothetical protein